MEETIGRAINFSQEGGSFYTFIKYFAPGMFAAFWVVVYAIRLAHIPIADPPQGYVIIATDTELLTFLHNNWTNMIGIVLALGSFVGVILVGVDPIVRAFMGSRGLNLIFKYLLSSKPVDFAYFQFMRLHDVSYRYERLPKELIRKRLPDSKEFDYVTSDEGDYARKYFFRESVQNHFWQHILKKENRTELSKEWDQASLFLYLSFVSLLIFVFQAFFFFEHIFSITVQNETFTWAKPYLPPILFDWINKYSLFDLVPLVLASYMLITFLYNLHRLTSNKPGNSNPRAWPKIPSRKALVFVSIIAYFAFCAAFHSKITMLAWLEPLDIFMFGFYFMSFVAFYWSGAFHFARYAIVFEQYFKQNEEQITEFIKQNSKLILDMDKSFGRTNNQGRTQTAVTDPIPSQPHLCSCCKAYSATAYNCRRCNTTFCQNCAAYTSFRCPHCLNLLVKT